MQRRSADSSNVTSSLEGSWRPGGDSNPRSAPAFYGGDVEKRSLLFVQATGSDPAIASPRECDCPEWAIHCRHFDGKCIRLSVQELTPAESQPTWSRPFAIDYNLKSICNEHDAWDCGCSEILGKYDTYADALAAFCAAEEQLLATAPRGSLPDAAQAARCPAGPSGSFSLGPQKEAPAAEESFSSAPALGELYGIEHNEGKRAN